MCKVSWIHAQSCPNGIPLYISTRCFQVHFIPHHPVEVLGLPQRARHSDEFVNRSTRPPLDAPNPFGQSLTLDSGDQMDVIWHDHKGNHVDSRVRRENLFHDDGCRTGLPEHARTVTGVKSGVKGAASVWDARNHIGIQLFRHLLRK